MTSLVFFGAGASKPFGIPTMQEMVEEFEAEIKKNDRLYGFYADIKAVLGHAYDDSEIDIEAILSVLYGISKNTQPVNMGFFTFYSVSKNCANEEFSHNNRNIAEDLKERIHNYIKNRCNPTQQLDETYKKSYHPFFRLIRDRNISDDNELDRDWKAYTTNYDNIFEDFCNEYEPPKDHFVPIDQSNRRVFSTEPLVGNHTFAKLHGSMDWTREVPNGQIVKRTRYSKVETKGDVMLFPTQQKDLYLHPWFALFQDLKTGLSSATVWYVIGYAFNDEFIRNAFQESLNEHAEKKLILINPLAKDIKSKFPTAVQDKIDILPILFGHSSFEQQFKDYLNNTKTVIMRFLVMHPSRKQKIKIECSKTLRRANLLNSEDDGFVLNPNTESFADGQIIGADQTYVNIEMRDLGHQMQVELDLSFDYNYGDEVSLTISDNVQTLDFSMECNGKTIIKSDAELVHHQEYSDVADLVRVKLDSKILYV